MDIEIYWQDLTEDKKKEIADYLGIPVNCVCPNMNWGTIPLFILHLIDRDGLFED